MCLSPRPAGFRVGRSADACRKTTVERTKAVQQQMNTATTALALNQADLFARVEENTRMLEQLVVVSRPSPSALFIPPSASSYPAALPAPVTHSEKQIEPVLPVSLDVLHCPVWCSCQCHRTLDLSTLNSVAPAMGSMHVVMAGGPLTSACSESTCRRRECPSMHVSLFPPSWAWSRMVSLSIAMNPLTGLNISMKTPRLVSGSHRVFHFALGGNIQALRMAFVDGQGSPHDVDGRTGSSLLHVGCSQTQGPLSLVLTMIPACRTE